VDLAGHKADVTFTARVG